MINNVTLTGRLTKVPELKYSTNNTAYVNFTLAVNRAFKTEKDTDFITCKVFNKQAENLAKFCGKGSLIGIIGSIQTGSYQNKQGNTVYTTDVMVNSIQFLETKQQREQQGQFNQGYNQSFNNNGYNQQNNFNQGYNNQNNVYNNKQAPDALEHIRQNNNTQMDFGFNPMMGVNNTNTVFEDIPNPFAED
ncbi:single-stranded DNA-binding protein [Gemella massiliensis]|uniref:single-stranded DNA-binding protein n=1 Tax=Gemella massiliensis TaxID=1909670 RepID=UPI000931EDEE|nr:single-stranded DNA-binding protein [Gemella massiliensis]